jgi:hypothetical protein
MTKKQIQISSIDDLKEGDEFYGYRIRRYDTKDSVWAENDNVPDIYTKQVEILIANGCNTVTREVERYRVMDSCVPETPWHVWDSDSLRIIGWFPAKAYAERICSLLNEAEKESK